MPKIPVFDPYKAGSRWVVNVPAYLSADGERHRKTFATEAPAQKFASKLRSTYGSGLRGALIPATLAAEAAEAERILEGTGISLLDAARQAAERAQATGPAETFKARLDRATASNEERWSEVYLRDVENLWRYLPAWFLATRCHKIDAPTIERAITEGRDLKRSSIDHRTRYVKAVLSHRERHHRDASPDLLTAAQVDALLAACNTPEETRCVAVLLYAGIRPSADGGEIMRLDWRDFRDGAIHVRQEASKTGTDRIIPITPRLGQLIAGHPDHGPVHAPNWKKAWQRIRKTAGVGHMNDCTRHSFASHYLAWKGEDATKAVMGHTAGSRTLFSFYARAVTPDAGAAYFAAR
ncbi:MAG: tyrosine-type recombinase/integrase [Alphaproteobacteria bacterium]